MKLIEKKKEEEELAEKKRREEMEEQLKDYKIMTPNTIDNINHNNNNNNDNNLLISESNNDINEFIKNLKLKNQNNRYDTILTENNNNNNNNNDVNNNKLYQTAEKEKHSRNKNDLLLSESIPFKRVTFSQLVKKTNMSENPLFNSTANLNQIFTEINNDEMNNYNNHNYPNYTNEKKYKRKYDNKDDKNIDDYKNEFNDIRISSNRENIKNKLNNLFKEKNNPNLDNFEHNNNDDNNNNNENYYLKIDKGESKMIPFDKNFVYPANSLEDVIDSKVMYLYGPQKLEK